MKVEEYNDVRAELLAQIGSEIGELVEEYDISYMEAVIMYGEKNDVELEMLGAVVKKHQKITNEIRKEAEALNFLEESNTYTITGD